MSAEISRRDQMAWATELALAIDAILQAVDNLKEKFFFFWAPNTRQLLLLS